MINFYFNTPIFAGRLDEIGYEIANDNSVNILLLTSRTVFEMNNVRELVSALKTRKSLTIDFIEPEAPVQKLDSIVTRTVKPDLIIAIGGGSTIDSAKAISFGWQNKSIIDILYKRESLPNSKIKVIAVPTTAGTGAELSFGAILTDKENQFKGGIRSPMILPDFVVIDKYLYINAGKKLKAEVGFDCLSHAIETYVSKNSSPFIKYQSINCITRIFSSLKNAVEGDLNALESIAISSCMMGVNLSYSSTCLPHRMQYALGPITNTSHAQGLIALYNGWLSMIKSEKVFAELSSNFGLNSEQFILKIQDIKSDLDIEYSLNDWKIDEVIIDRMTAAVTGNVELDPCYESKETIRNIFINSL